LSNHKRKIRRNKKKRTEKELREKLMMFDKLPEECSACQKVFDKRSKEQVLNWNVVVRKKEEIVRLYCPECWKKAIDLIKQVEENEKE
jgi:hypothetical protein